MTLEQLQKFIREEHQRMVTLWGKEEDQKQRTLYRTIKLMEEVGELCEEILGFTAGQRKEKMREKNHQALAEELADVIVVALLLAENMQIDVLTAIEKKKQKIEQRYVDKS